VEVAVKKALLLIGAALAMAACSETTTAPSAARKLAPTTNASGDLVCRSGYMVAYDENGNPYCTPIDPTGSAAKQKP
jgi:hypothetical protein